jgi:sugar phosphate isomerase/epimerase
MVAAPPAGATKGPKLDLREVAHRYRQLLEIGDQAGVIPQLEVWGFSSNLHQIGEVMYVAAESGHPEACILPDVYHIYKGGSDFNGLRLLDGSALHMFHVNDYPADPPRQEIGDRDRVYPGDGIAPLDHIIGILHDKKEPIILSLELFNRQYWEQDPLEVAKTGLRKMKNAVNNAIG